MSSIQSPQDYMRLEEEAYKGTNPRRRASRLQEALAGCRNPIRQRRMEKGMSKMELGAMANVSEKVIERLEGEGFNAKGKGLSTISSFLKVAAALDADTGELIDEYEQYLIGTYCAGTIMKGFRDAKTP